MEKPRPAKLKRPRILGLILAQLSIVILTMITSFLVAGSGAALSALLGGLVAWLSNSYFAWRTFRFQGARYTQQVVKSLYQAEAGKFGLTVALFTLIFITVPPSNPALFFGAYVAMLFANWLTSWLLQRPLRT